MGNFVLGRTAEHQVAMVLETSKNLINLLG
jgi:hypothetical protein